MRPSNGLPHELLHDAELGVRSSLIYGNLLAARLTLARTNGLQAVAGVCAADLARMVAASRTLVAAADAVLVRVAPQLAAHAGLMAEEICRREMVDLWPDAPRRHLVLVSRSGS